MRVDGKVGVEQNIRGKESQGANPCQGRRRLGHVFEKVVKPYKKSRRGGLGHMGESVCESIGDE